MTRRLFVAILTLGLLVPARGEAEVYFAFSAEQMEYQGQQRIFFVPFSFTGPTHRQMERKIAVLFEKLHGSRQSIYGSTQLVVRQEKNGFRADLQLDPDAARFHDIIIGEIYLTLTNIGITDVFVGPEKKAVTDSEVKFPYFIPTIPLWEALPPATFPHALVRLGINEYVESKTFHEGMTNKDPRLYERILLLLKRREPYVQLRVLQAFPFLKVAAEADHLLPLLNDPALSVVYKSIELLATHSEPKVLDALATLADGSKDPETQLRAARILVKNGRTNYQLYILFEQLKSKDTAVVVKTLQKLASSGDKRVLPALVRNLSHTKEEVKKAAFAGLKQIRDLENLKSLLSNQEIEERYRKETAIELMRQSDPAYSKDGIGYLVKNHQGDEAVEAVTTIEMRKYVDQADLLVYALAHQDEQVALTGVAAIGNLGLIDHLPDLSTASRTKGLTKASRDTIAKLLAAQPLKAVMKLARAQDIVIRELAVLALVKEAKARAAQKKNIDAVLDLLGESMKDKEQLIKRAAVAALHEIGGTRNWKRLLRMKKDRDPKIRMVVGRAALSLKNEAGDAVILELLADEDDGVRVAAIKSIRTRKIKSARPKLKFMIESRNKVQKTAALRTIVVLNESGDEHKEFFEIYKKLLFEMDAEIQLAAIKGIQWIIDPMVVPLLQSGILIMHKDKRVRAATLVALGRSRDYNVVEHIARGFADPEKEVQGAAIEGLRLMGHKKGVTPLKEYIKQSDDEDLIARARAAIDELETKPKGLLDD